jgi:hypothetical protein
MKSIKLILFCFICFAKSYGQVTSSYNRLNVEIVKKRGKISSNVEMISSAERDSAWVQSLKKNIIESFQDGKRLKKGKYLVVVKFIIARDGSVSDIICEKDPGFGMCEKVIRVVKKSKSSRWKPSEPVEVREFNSPKG